jgi:dipeptidyl-peptidase-3
VGLPALKNFLLKLNVFKATADLENATNMFSKYSEVNPLFLELREVVLSNKTERGLEVKGNIRQKAGQFIYD